MFGDVETRRIIGKGNTIREDVPHLNDVYLVNGLKMNLISMSQLCSEGLKVVFNTVQCWIYNENGMVQMMGVRREDNCYMWKGCQDPQKGIQMSFDVTLNPCKWLTNSLSKLRD